MFPGNLHYVIGEKNSPYILLNNVNEKYVCACTYDYTSHIFAKFYVIWKIADVLNEKLIYDKRSN